MFLRSSTLLPLAVCVMVGGVAACGFLSSLSGTESRRAPLVDLDHPAHFPLAEECAHCHSSSPESTALTTATGEDVSQHWLWQGTMMAQAFFDPYWRAQVEDSVLALGGGEAGSQLEALCVRCHAPAATYGARLRGEPAPDIATAAFDPISAEGVNCSFCHRISGETFASGIPHTGEMEIGPPGVYRGPIEQPSLASLDTFASEVPMEHGYDYMFEDSAFCASCHTLRTENASESGSFLEQSPYLEWQNSVYSDLPFPTRESRTCQECHMPRAMDTRLARRPDGSEDDVPVRKHFETHSFVGANAFMLELMADNAVELGVVADPKAMRHVARLSRRFLAENTARLRRTEAIWSHGRLQFAVEIENLAGHRFPSAYPSRRAWLEVVVRRGDAVLFSSGTPDARGRLPGDGNGVRAHVTKISSPRDILVYEMVPGDANGRPTTTIVDMTKRLKDNRLLPKGWQHSGANAAETGPVGADHDLNFIAGSDGIDIDIPLRGRGAVEVSVRLHYQGIPPVWVDRLRDNDAPSAKRFVRLYDSRERMSELVDELHFVVK